MADYLFDSGIFILHLRSQPGYFELTRRLMNEADVNISAMSRLEIVRGMRDHERSKTLAVLDSVITISITARIADLAGELIRSYRARGATIGDADAVIAASAIHHKLTLVTTNARHFPMPELSILQADEEGRLSPVAR